MKKILVSLPSDIVDLVDNELLGKIGEKRSDTLRTIIMIWLSEKGYLNKGGKNEKSEKTKQELAEEVERERKLIEEHLGNI